MNMERSGLFFSLFPSSPSSYFLFFPPFQLLSAVFLLYAVARINSGFWSLMKDLKVGKRPIGELAHFWLFSTPDNIFLHKNQRTAVTGTLSLWPDANTINPLSCTDAPGHFKRTFGLPYTITSDEGNTLYNQITCLEVFHNFLDLHQSCLLKYIIEKVLGLVSFYFMFLKDINKDALIWSKIQ